MYKTLEAWLSNMDGICIPFLMGIRSHHTHPLLKLLGLIIGIAEKSQDHQGTGDICSGFLH
jgi:hypothetical protein